MDQKKEITDSLRSIVGIFKTCNAEYRVLGSVLIVGHTNSVFREIHDVDVLIDKQSFGCVLEQLHIQGFNITKRRKILFEWIETEKKGHLGVTFMLVGDFKPGYFTWRFGKIFELRIRQEYLKPTTYSFNDIFFIGIPIESAIAGIRMSFLNPKRKMDKKVLADEMRTTRVRTYGNITVYIFGIPIPYLYDAFSFFYNIYGGLRVVLGKKYEIW